MAARGKRRRTYRTGSLFKRSKIWWIQIRAGSGRERYRESSKSENRSDAEVLLLKRLGEVASNQRRVGLRATVSDLCELVIQDYRLHRRRDVDHVMWRFEKHMKPLLGSVLATQFGSDDVANYIVRRQSADASDSTINRELAIIRRAFSLAHRARPPLISSVPFIEKLEEGDPREGFLEHTQYTALRNALPQHLKCLFVVAYHLGCRKGELLAISKEQVDLAGGEIRLTRRQTKNKRPRTLPIYGEMRPWMEMQLTELMQR